MNRTIVLIVVVSLFFAGQSLQAQCSTCSLPPPHTAYTCGHTFYSAGTRCAFSSDQKICYVVGDCIGTLPDCDPRCPLEVWACYEPLEKDWILEEVVVEVAESVPDQIQPV
jgi:hypothetical protein